MGFHESRKYLNSKFIDKSRKGCFASNIIFWIFYLELKIIVDLFRRDNITFEKARESLEKLGVIGRYSPEILADAMLSLREENNGKAHNHKDT